MTEPAPRSIRSRWQPPQELLDRHEARVLRPAEAMRPAGEENLRLRLRLESTVYRAREILVPGAPLLDREDPSFPRFAIFVSSALAGLGLVAERLGEDGGADGPNGLARFQREFQEAGRPRVVALRLRPAPGLVPDRAIDAWEVLQKLRFAAAGSDPPIKLPLELNHLLFACRGHIIRPARTVILGVSHERMTGDGHRRARGSVPRR